MLPEGMVPRVWGIMATHNALFWRLLCCQISYLQAGKLHLIKLSGVRPGALQIARQTRDNSASTVQKFQTSLISTFFLEAI